MTSARSRAVGWTVAAASAIAVLFHLYAAGISPFTALIQRPVHLALMSTLGFLGVGVQRRIRRRKADRDAAEEGEADSSDAPAAESEATLEQLTELADGGALALGHPLGATGARITGKAAQILKRQSGRYALSTQCIGGGQGIATVLESIS